MIITVRRFAALVAVVGMASTIAMSTYVAGAATGQQSTPPPQQISVSELNQRIAAAGGDSGLDPTGSDVEWRSEMRSDGSVVHMFGEGLDSIPLYDDTVFYSEGDPNTETSGTWSNPPADEPSQPAIEAAASWSCYVSQDPIVSYQTSTRYLYYGAAVSCYNVYRHRGAGYIDRSSWSGWRVWKGPSYWTWSSQTTLDGTIVIGRCGTNQGTYDYRGSFQSQVQPTAGDYRYSPWYYSWEKQRRACGTSPA